MKRLLVVVAIIMMLGMPVVGHAVWDGQDQIQIQEQTQTQSTSNNNVNQNSPKTWLYVTASPKADSSNQNTVAPVQSTDINMVTERGVIATPQIVPMEIPILQSGKIGDYTSVLPKIKGLTKLGPTDTVVDIVAVYDGWFMSRIRLADLEKKLIATKIAGAKIRYSVKFKDSASSGGIGGGIAGANATVNGLTSVAGSVLPGYHSSTADPQFIITYYCVE
jgi:hypothetical protein